METPLYDELQREQDLAGVRAVLCDTSCGAPQQIAADDEVGISAADAFRTSVLVEKIFPTRCAIGEH